MSIKIGNLNLECGLILAPMAGYTDRAMRLICHQWGAELTYTEMVSARATVYGDKKTATLSRIRRDEGAVALQIFGSDPSVMAEAAGILEGGCCGEEYAPPVAIDINMGCPVHKIFSNGEGSALMRSPELIYDIVRAVRGSIKIPLTVKMRLGINEGACNVFECAKAAEEGGADMIAVHGRYKSQLYGGTADMETIGRLKSTLNIPLVANGDIRDVSSALCAISHTGADGIMIGRGAVGNPFIFGQIRSAMLGDPHPTVTEADRISAAKRQLEYACGDKGESVAVMEARKQIALYFKGHRGTAALRAKINSLTTFGEVCEAIDQCFAE